MADVGDKAGPPERRVVLPTVATDTYVIDGEIAHGGLGRVLKAHDVRLQRTVAIKELLPGEHASEVRFVREALVTAQLEHPAIVPVHEAGRWPSGEPFYAMKLVSGRPLSEVIPDATDYHARLALLPHVIAVAEAIAYAHSKGVIHRDIKPANVIIGQFGETVVIDWGVAKVLPAPEGETIVELGVDSQTVTHLGGTVVGDVIGTPAYMSPEQARGERVDERTDVYALGTLLYQVLSGTTPYSPKLSTLSEAETGVVAQSNSPTELLAKIITRDAVPLAERAPEVPPDLLAIVRKAMARRAADRYPSASELAADLKRFQTGQLVRAQSYSTWALARRWLLRNRGMVGVAAVALVLLVLGAALSVARIIRARGAAEEQRRIAEGQRNEAQIARQEAEARENELILLQARASLAGDPTASLAWLKLYPAHAPAWAAARAIADDARSRGVARSVWRGHGGDVLAVAFAPDGQTVASASVDRTLRLWQPDSGRSRVLTAPQGLRAVAYSPDGQLLAAASEDGAVLLWSVTRLSAPPRTIGRHDDAVTAVAFSPDGRLVGSASLDQTVRIWNLADGTTQKLDGHTGAIWGVAFAPDGRTLASASDDKTVRLWSLATGEARVFVSPSTARAVAFSPDGKWVAAASGAAVQLWQVDGDATRRFNVGSATVATVVFSPDGRTLGTGVNDGSIRLWDLASGETRFLRGHEGSPKGLAFSPDGSLLASASKDSTVRLWALGGEDGRALIGVAGGAGCSAFSPDGRTVAVAAGDGAIQLWSLGDDSPSRALRGHTARVPCFAWSPDGRALASFGDDHTVRLWDVARGTGRVLAETAKPVGRIHFSPDGKHLAFAEGFEAVTIVDADTGAVGCVFRGRNQTASTFSPDGKSVVYATVHEVRLGDVTTCASRVLYRHGGWINGLAFTSDGRWLASAGYDKLVGLYDVAAGTARMLGGHDTDVYRVGFSPDGKLLASGSADHTIRLWSVPGGALVRVLVGHDEPVLSVLFTPDGQVLVSSAMDRTVRLWSVATGEEARVLRGHEAVMRGLDVSPDGKLVVSSSEDGAVRVWPVSLAAGLPDGAAELRAWLGRTTTAQIDSRHLVTSP